MWIWFSLIAAFFFLHYLAGAILAVLGEPISAGELEVLFVRFLLMVILARVEYHIKAFGDNNRDSARWHAEHK